MLRYLLSGALLSCVHVVAVHADGVAVFVSLTDASGTRQTRERLQASLDIAVEVSRLDIDGTPWIRLHSAVMPESEARELVERARRGGYSAWYNGSGDSLVTSSSAAAAAMPTLQGALVDDPRAARNTADPAAEYDYGDVTPATHDVSHLPLAETLPVDDAEPN